MVLRVFQLNRTTGEWLTIWARHKFQKFEGKKQEPNRTPSEQDRTEDRKNNTTTDNTNNDNTNRKPNRYLSFVILSAISLCIYSLMLCKYEYIYVEFGLRLRLWDWDGECEYSPCQSNVGVWFRFCCCCCCCSHRRPNSPFVIQIFARHFTNRLFLRFFPHFDLVAFLTVFFLAFYSISHTLAIFLVVPTTGTRENQRHRNASSHWVSRCVCRFHLHPFDSDSLLQIAILFANGFCGGCLFILPISSYPSLSRTFL